MKKLLILVLLSMMGAGLLQAQTWSRGIKKDSIKAGSIETIEYVNNGIGRNLYFAIKDTAITTTADSLSVHIVLRLNSTTNDTVRIGAINLSTNAIANVISNGSTRQAYRINYEYPWIVLIKRINVLTKTGNYTEVLFWAK